MRPETIDDQESSISLPPRKSRGQQKKKYHRKQILITLDLLEDYCKRCVTWEEAKPIIDMLLGLFPRGRPREIDLAIGRIKAYFNEKLFGKAIQAKTIKMKVGHSDVTVGVAENGSEIYHHHKCNKNHGR